MNPYYPADDFENQDYFEPGSAADFRRRQSKAKRAGYFHPFMSAWTIEEHKLAKIIDETAWRPFALGDSNSFKNDMGWRRQRSLEKARYQLGNWSLDVPVPDYVLETSTQTATPKGKTSMNQTVNPSLAVFLINRDVRGVMCAYDFEDDTQKTPKYGKTYLFKTLDQTIQKGDLVIVPTSTRVGFTVVKVLDADVEPDYNSDIDYKWIVSKLDKTGYEDLLKKEDAGKAAIREAEKLRARKDLSEKLFDLNIEKLKSLPLYKNGEPSIPARAPNDGKTGAGE